MSQDSGYYRHPTIHGETVVFVCEDDLWSVPLGGGIARRLTADPGAVSFPAFSPDGSRIAFTCRNDGPPEVFVMGADGGEVRRLTWVGGLNQVAGWTPNGREVIFASDWRQPFMGYAHLHTVPASGGTPRRLGHGPARAISYQKDGPGVVIGRNSGDPARWKRYRGGTAGTIWIDRAGNGEFAPLIKLAGNLASPMWVGARIYFLSDHEGVGNLYSCTPTGRDLKRHTHHEDYYVRFPSSDGATIVYHAGADLYAYLPAAKEERLIAVRMRSSRSQTHRKFVSGARAFEGFSLHPKGQAIASVHRGAVFAMDLWEGSANRQSGDAGCRERSARWLPDGKRILAVTDEKGEEGLVIRPVNGGGEAKRIDGDFGRVIDIEPAPAGADRAAVCNHRQEILLVDLKSGRSKKIAETRFGRIDGVAWSPDGRWIAYGLPDGYRTSSIHLYDTSTGADYQITRSDFRDGAPAFDPEGRYLYFISYRIFDPVYDSHHFDLGFPRGARPFLIPLRRETPSPFSSAARLPRAPGAPANSADAKAGEKKGSAGDPVKVEIDIEGIGDRIVAFPVPEGRYAKILGAKGRALFASLSIEGSLDQTWYTMGEPPARMRLEAYDLDAAKTELVHEKVTDFAASADGKVLAIRSGNRLRVVPAGFKPDGKPGNDTPGRESGWLDMDRVRVSVVPLKEWRQMFREAWRLQRDQYWTPDMAGIDWKAIHDRYLRLVDRAACRSEFSDLLWEMQGELGTSHCYEMGGDYRPEPAWHQGFLGADLEFDRKAGVWRVARIPRGDSWEEKRSSPLAAPGLNVKVGDEILEVAGMPVGAEISPYERLVNLSGADVLLRVRSHATTASAARGAKAPKPAEPRTLTVRLLREEYSLRYRDWVEANRAWVHKATGGRVGYIHIPNMGPLGYSEFHRYYLTEVHKDGLIVDVRWNGGGHVSQLLLEKLLRRRVGYDANRWGVPESYPMDAPMGPMVALTNEYAGSDGDIFSHSFKLFKLGPLVGKRTWGGVVGIWPRHSLVDGTVTTQPEFAFWFNDVGWGVENYGTDPDIEVEIKPQDHAAGRDPQMDRGIAEILKMLKKSPPRVPDLGNRPRLGPGTLPPRG